MPDWTALLKFVYSPDSILIFGLLNCVAYGAHRAAWLNEKWTFLVVAVIGGFVGALTSYSEALNAAGTSPVVLTRAGTVGVILGAGSSTVLGWTLSTLLETIGLARSAAKMRSEAIRDPGNAAVNP